MLNEISVHIAVVKDPSEFDLFLKPTLLIDGQELSQHFHGRELQSMCALASPHLVLNLALDDYEPVSSGEFSRARASMQDQYLEWAGYSALTFDSSGYPFNKIPLMSCCGEEIDGYFACSMVREGDQVVWRDFGSVTPGWENTRWFRSPTGFSFTPDTTAVEFRFDRVAYERSLKRILRNPLLDEITDSSRVRPKRHSPKLFAASRGFAFPEAIRTRLARELLRADPLDLRRLGSVSPDVYAGLPSGFWRIQYKQFQGDPVACVVEALRSAYGLPVSAQAVEEAVNQTL